MDKNPYIQHCPNECDSQLKDSSIVMPEGRLKYCPICGQLVSQCTEELYRTMNEQWNTDMGTWPSRDATRRFSHRKVRTIRNIMKILSKKDYGFSLLDVGCSSGSFLSIAEHLGLKPEGVERAEKPALYAKTKGLKVHVGTLQDLHLPQDSYDAITMFEVIEHIKDAVLLLNECYRLLRPKGVLVIGTCNTKSWTRSFMQNRWDYLDLHTGHINFFNTGSMRSLAKKTRFHVHHISTCGVKFYGKGEVSYGRYRLFRIVSELLNLPSKILGKGHQMEAYLVSLKQ